MGELDENVRNNLRAIREQRGFSREELSDRCDLEPRDVDEIERGERKLLVEDLLKLAVELETRVSDFFVRNGQPEDHARSIDRYTYDLGTLIEGSQSAGATSPVSGLESLIDLSEVLLVLLDDDGGILQGNQQYQKLVGDDSGGDETPLFWKTSLWFEANERRMRHLIDEAREGRFIREVLPVRTSGGTTRPMTISVCPVRSNSNPSSFLLVEGEMVPRS